MQYVRVAVHGLIKKDDKFLVTKRSFDDDYMPGYWDIPGGTIKFQENTFDALNREILEETGLKKVKIGQIIFCYDFPSGPDRHQFQIVYECKLDSRETPPAPGSTSANSEDIFSTGGDTVVSSTAEKWFLNGDSESGAAGILRKSSKYAGGEVTLNSECHDEYKWVSLAEAKKLDNKIAFLDALCKYLEPEN